MLKIVYDVCCGIDIHKKFVVATIASTQNGITSYQTQNFSTFSDDLIKLNNWLVRNNCKHVCMESTGKYWIPVYNLLEDCCTITLANPRYVKNIPGKKTDKRDSIWLSDLHKHGLVRGSFIPPKQIRQLRELVRYKQKLTCFKSSEKNRLQNSLTVSNIMIANVVSDTFGKSSSAIINYMIENPEAENIDLSSMLKGALRYKSADIARSLNHSSLSSDQASKMSLCIKHHDYLNSCIETLNETIKVISSPFENEINLVTTIPGIKENSATVIISEIGTNMSCFQSSKHLCSWAGLTPQNNESAGKKKSTRISRAGAYLKPILVQCALAAIKSKDCSVFRLRYERIKRRRGHKKAIIAIARMLLTCIYNMLLKCEEFDATLYEDSCTEKITVNQYSVNQAIYLLQSMGFEVSMPDTSENLSP